MVAQLGTYPTRHSILLVLARLYLGEAVYAFSALPHQVNTIDDATITPLFHSRHFSFVDRSESSFLQKCEME